MRAMILNRAIWPLQHLVLAVAALLWLATPSWADAITPFVGSYKGSAEVINTDGTSSPRNMSVKIAETDNGFSVSWETTTHKTDGRVKEQSYSIDFVSTGRSSVYSAAMKRNVFGHEVPLDPMKVSRSYGAG